MPKYLHVFLYVSLDRAPNILKRALLRGLSETTANFWDVCGLKNFCGYFSEAVRTPLLIPGTFIDL